MRGGLQFLDLAFRLGLAAVGWGADCLGGQEICGVAWIGVPWLPEQWSVRSASAVCSCGRQHAKRFAAEVRSSMRSAVRRCMVAEARLHSHVQLTSA